MALMIAGLVVFFAPHFVRMFVPSLREAGITRLGENGWKGLYSLVSLIGIVVIVFGWREFRPDASIVYDPPTWGRRVAELLIPLALILNFTASKPVGRIKSLVQHPFLLAVALWSVGHLFANGDQASVIVFGSFLAYAVANALAVTRRGEPRAEFESYVSDFRAILIGVGLTVVIMLWLHPWIAGVALF